MTTMTETAAKSAVANTKVRMCFVGAGKKKQKLVSP